MKNLALKLLVQLMAIPSIFILAISAYYLYSSYQNYENAQTLSSNISIHRELNKLLISIEDEKAKSYTYYLSKNEIPLAKANLEVARKRLDEKLISLNKFVKKNHLSLNEDIRKLLSDMKHLLNLRSDIDNFKNNDFEILYDKLSSYITHYEKKSFKDVNINDLKPLLDLKISLKDLVNKSFIERTIVSYYLSQDIVMEEDQYKRLKNHIQLNFYHLNIDRTILDKKVLNFLDSKKFNYILQDLYDARKSIDTTMLRYLDDGEFYGWTIDNLDWSMINNEYVKSLNFIVEDLNAEILKKVKNIQNHETTILIGAFLIFLFSIFILSVNILLARWTNKRVEKFSKLMRSIADVTKDKKEIELLTEQGQEEAFDTVDEAIAQVKDDRKKAESANRAKSIFLANMSHEIRTPLNGVLGFVALLKESKLSLEQQEYLNIIELSSQTLLEVINNILDISKLESGKMELYLSETNIANIAKTTIKLFKAKSSEKNIELKSYIDPSLPIEVFADSLKIKEILSNLIGNAIKFTDIDGHISINIKLKDIKNKMAKIYFEVVDDGIGIAPEKQQNIFNAFEQAEQSTTKEYGGTGLGVSIVNSYLELMDSELKLESALGKGTKFYFELELDFSNYQQRRVNKKYCNINIAYYTPEHKLLDKAIKDYLSFYQVHLSKAFRLSSLEKMFKENNLSAIVVECRYLDDSLINFVNKNNIEVLVYSETKNIDELKDKLTTKVKFLYMPIFICDIEKIIASISGTTVSCSKYRVKISDLRVMIVEDDKINQNVLKAMFNKMSVETSMFNNGKEALKEYVLNYNKYDMIIMDLRMPELDGINATKFILNFEEKNNLPHTPIIALTADVTEKNKDDFLGAGADEFLSKPTKQNELLETINKIINRGI